jgi:hypothetical protein
MPFFCCSLASLFESNAHKIWLGSRKGLSIILDHTSKKGTPAPKKRKKKKRSHSGSGRDVRNEEKKQIHKPQRSKRRTHQCDRVICLGFVSLLTPSNMVCTNPNPPATTAAIGRAPLSIFTTITPPAPPAPPTITTTTTTSPPAYNPSPRPPAPTTNPPFPPLPPHPPLASAAPPPAAAVVTCLLPTARVFVRRSDDEGTERGLRWPERSIKTDGTGTRPQNKPQRHLNRYIHTPQPHT